MLNRSSVIRARMCRKQCLPVNWSRQKTNFRVPFVLHRMRASRNRSMAFHLSHRCAPAANHLCVARGALEIPVIVILSDPNDAESRGLPLPPPQSTRESVAPCEHSILSLFVCLCVCACVEGAHIGIDFKPWRQNNDERCGEQRSLSRARACVCGNERKL